MKKRILLILLVLIAIISKSQNKIAFLDKEFNSNKALIVMKSKAEVMVMVNAEPYLTVVDTLLSYEYVFYTNFSIFFDTTGDIILTTILHKEKLYYMREYKLVEESTIGKKEDRLYMMSFKRKDNEDEDLIIVIDFNNKVLMVNQFNNKRYNHKVYLRTVYFIKDIKLLKKDIEEYLSFK